jgi:hypothetical protein
MKSRVAKQHDNGRPDVDAAGLSERLHGKPFFEALDPFRAAKVQNLILNRSVAVGSEQYSGGLLSFNCPACLFEADKIFGMGYSIQQNSSLHISSGKPVA